MQGYNIEELDLWLGFLPGCDFYGIRAGQTALTTKNQKVIILGFSTNYIDSTQYTKATKAQIQDIKVTMKQQDKSKVICLYQSSTVQETMILDPQDLTPYVDTTEFNFLDSKDLQQKLIQQLINKKPKDYDRQQYQEKIRYQIIQNQLIKFFKHQIQIRGQEFINIMQENGVLQQFLEKIFHNSSQPFLIPKAEQLPIQHMEQKIYLLRQKALETNECLNSYTGITAVLQNNKYLVLKGLHDQSDDIVSFPISGCINIESNIKSPVLTCRYASDMIDIREEIYDMIIIPASMFENDPEKAFSLIHNSKISITSEEIDLWSLFVQMRRLSKKDPKRFDGLAEKIVITLEKADFDQVQNPKLIQFVKKPKINAKESTLDVLCSLLDKWGSCSPELIDYMMNTQLNDPAQIQEKLIDALNPDTFKDILEDWQMNKQAEESLQSEIASQNIESDSLMMSSAERIQFESLSRFHFEEEPVDLNDNLAVRSKIKLLLEKNILPLEDNNKNYQLYGNERYFDDVVDQVRQASGEIFLRDYHQTLANYNMLINRETFLSILEHSEFENIAPHLLQRDVDKKNFAQYLKISFNEALKSKNQQSKQTLKFIKEVITKIVKASTQNEEYAQFLTDFYINEVIQGGMLALSAMERVTETLIQTVFYQQEDQAVKYSNPKMFLFMTQLFINHNKEILLSKSTTLANAMTLSTAYAIYVSQTSSQQRDKFLNIVLELVYLTHENVKTFDIKTIENVANNSLMIMIGEQLQNKKDNEKASQAQKIISETYIAMLNLRKKAEAQRERINSNMLMNKYLNSVRKMERAIEECNKGSFEYLKYLEFYKSMDKDLLEFLAQQFSTTHNMYNAPIKAYKKIAECQKMKIIINAKTRLPQFTQLAITSDPEGKNLIKRVSTEELIENMTIDVYRNDFYLHYPYKQTNLIAFGLQTNGRLGNGKNTQEIIPIIVDLPFTPKLKVKEIFARKNFCAILDSQNQIHVTGVVKGTSEYHTFKHQKLPNDASVDLLAVGKFSIIVRGTDKKWYAYGRSRLGHFANSDTDYDSFKEITSGMEALKKHKVIQIASGSQFSLFVTDQGLLFGRGDTFLESIGVAGAQKLQPIPLNEKYTVKKVYCSQGNSKQSASAIIEVYDKEDKIKKLLSGGKSTFGLLGQGQGVIESNTFKDMAIHFSILSFTDIQMYTRQALAISKDGSLYVWGSNEHGLLGIEKLNEIIYTPTQNEYFKNYSINSITCGQYHSLVSASLKKKSKSSTIFSIGRPIVNNEFAYLGINEGESKNQNQFIWNLKQFDGMQTQKLAAGFKSSFILCDQQESIHQMDKHQITPTLYEDGILHFYYDREGKLVKIPQSQFQREKNNLPDVCFAIKYPIKNLENRKFTVDLQNLQTQLMGTKDFVYHEGIQDSLTEDDIIGPRYYTKSQVIPGTLKIYNYSEESFLKTKDSDIDPLIFLRLARPIEPNVELPTFEIADYYEQNEFYGIDITIKPDYKSDISKQLIQFATELYDQKTKYLNYFDKERIALIKDFITTQNLTDDSLTDAFKKLKTHRQEYIDLDTKSDDNVALIVNIKFLPLLKMPEEAYDLIQNILQTQNKYFTRFMKTVAMGRTQFPYQDKYGWQNYLDMIKKEMMIHVKRKIINQMISKLSTSGEGSVTIKRRKAFYFCNSGQVDHEGKETIFGQVFQQMRTDNFESFKKNNVDSKVFNVTFSGEGSQDAGGPFRDCITNMCLELQSEALPILIRSPNNKNNHGQYRECWIPNPSSNNPTHSDLFKFFGCMIGWGIRSTSSLQLDLPPIFWKKIIGVQPDEHDLKLIDTYSWQVIEDLRENLKKLTKEEFDSGVDQQFVTLLSDGTEKELCFKGREKNVTSENVEEFITLMIAARLSEFDDQMKQIKVGINIIIPAHVLFFMTWQELDLRATGAKTIELDTLKKITIYDTCNEDSECVKQFWKVFATLTEEERSLYLKFVWGRSRLPMNLDNLSRKHCIEYFKSRAKDSLPISHTWQLLIFQPSYSFFRVDLPDYSSEEILKKRLVYAINFCGDIDADRGRHDIADEDS